MALAGHIAGTKGKYFFRVVRMLLNEEAMLIRR
jgi:hypothetical protein